MKVSKSWNGHRLLLQGARTWTEGWKDGPVVKCMGYSSRDPSLVPSTHVRQITTNCNSSSGGLTFSPRTPEHMWRTFTQTYIHIGIRKNKSSSKQPNWPLKGCYGLGGRMCLEGGWGSWVMCRRECTDRGIVLDGVGPSTQYLWHHSVLEGPGGRQFRIEPWYFLSAQTQWETPRFQHMGEASPFWSQ